MARPRQRVRLQDGLWIDLNKLLRDGPPGTIPWPIEIRWEGEDRGYLRIVMGELDQRLELVAQPRHFGGRQWYFRCPVTSPQVFCGVATARREPVL